MNDAPPATVHSLTCDLDEDCGCALAEGACPYCFGSGVAFDPTTNEGPRCPGCGGTGRDA